MSKKMAMTVYLCQIEIVWVFCEDQGSFFSLVRVRVYYSTMGEEEESTTTKIEI